MRSLLFGTSQKKPWTSTYKTSSSQRESVITALRRIQAAVQERRASIQNIGQIADHVLFEADILLSCGTSQVVDAYIESLAPSDGVQVKPRLRVLTWQVIDLHDFKKSLATHLVRVGLAPNGSEFYEGLAQARHAQKQRNTRKTLFGRLRT